MDHTPEQSVAGCTHRRTHQHGTPAAYRYCGCRCGLCVLAAKRAHTAWTVARRERLAMGEAMPATRVDASAARAHVATLMAAGMQPSALARLSGVSRTTVANLADGRFSRLSAVTRDALLAIPVPTVTLIGAQRRVDALLADGWTLGQIGVRVGVSLSTIWRIGRGERVASTTTLARLAEVFEAMAGSTEVVSPPRVAPDAPRSVQWIDRAIDDPSVGPAPRTAPAIDVSEVAHLLDAGYDPVEISRRLGRRRDRIGDALRRHGDRGLTVRWFRG